MKLTTGRPNKAQPAMKIFGFVLLCSLLLAPFCAARAQSGKFPRIGYLGAVPAAAIASRVTAFRQALRELGYVEGKNIDIEFRWADGNLELAPKLADELVRLNVDVIVTAGPMDTRNAKKATSNIPIIMTWDQDPIGSGFVASLSHPGGNITGLSIQAPEISTKQLELLKESVPKLRRVAYLGNASEPGSSQALKETQTAAKILGLQIQSLDVPAPQEIDAAFRAAINGGNQAAMVLTTPITFTHRKEVIATAAKLRLPAIYHRAAFVEQGGLMSYGVVQNDLDRRAAVYVDKILKGTKPADLPVEQPKKFEFVVNLNAAKQIGLAIPPNVLARADKVIR